MSLFDLEFSESSCSRALAPACGALVEVYKICLFQELIDFSVLANILNLRILKCYTVYFYIQEKREKTNKQKGKKDSGLAVLYTDSKKFLYMTVRIQNNLGRKVNSNYMNYIKFSQNKTGDTINYLYVEKLISQNTRLYQR